VSRRITLFGLLTWTRSTLKYSRIEVGLLVVVCRVLVWIFKVKVSREIAQFSGLEPICHQWFYRTAQYLNVRHRKLGSYIIQIVYILEDDSAVTDSLPEGEYVSGHSNLLSNNLAPQ
jgi:hypothetical protein